MPGVGGSVSATGPPSSDDSPQQPCNDYRRADEDIEFLTGDEIRAVRIQLEWCKRGLIQPNDLDLFHVAESAQEAWDLIMKDHQKVPIP